jgi:hypothetical protein
MRIDYSIYYKEVVDNKNFFSSHNFDLFISAYENCERVLNTFKQVNAKNKLWLLFPQYDYGVIDIKESHFSSERLTEDEYFYELFEQVKINPGISLCIDISGFLRPHMIYLIRYLSYAGMKNIDILYTEPKMYVKGEKTDFSGFIERVELVPGCSANDVNPQTENDILIIGAGYDTTIN